MLDRQSNSYLNFATRSRPVFTLFVTMDNKTPFDMLDRGIPWEHVSPKTLVLAGVVMVVLWSTLKWVLYFLMNFIRPHSTPELGKLWSLRDIFQDVGIDNDTCKALQEGYYKYSKKGEAFWMNNFPLASDLVLPPTEIRRLMKEPDSVLSVSANLEQNFAIDYTMPFLAHPTHENVIRKYLTKKLPELTADLMDEIEASLADIWGTDTENFKEVDIMHSVEKILARSDNRAFTGLPLCRNDDYLKMTVKFAEDVAVAGKIINVLPRWSKPVLGRLFTIPNHIHYRKARKHLIPHIKQRLEAWDSTEEKSPHNDFITWIIQDAKKHGDEEGLDPGVISFRIIDVNFAAIHTSSFTSTNALLDIASFPADNDGTTLFDSLREEVMRVFHEENGQWTKAGLERLVRVDSSIRESMRHTGIFFKGVMRKVVDPNGYQATPEIHIPTGTNVGSSAYSVHHDTAFYNDPYRYNPFRFSEPREHAAREAAKDEVENDTKQELENAVAKDKTSSMNQTTETFLAWGHGRKACPGRYFATDVIRLMIAAMVKDYEIEPLETRPRNKWILDTIIPQAGAKLRIRRRQV